MSNTTIIKHGGRKNSKIRFEKNEFYIANKGKLDEVIVWCTDDSPPLVDFFSGKKVSGIKYGKFEYSDSWLKKVFEPFIGKVIFESNLEKEDE